MKKIIVSDVSLKDSVKKETASFSFKEKCEIAKKLCDLSVDVIEFGTISNDKAEEILIKTICSRLGLRKISLGVGFTSDSVQKAFELIKGAKNKRLTVNMPVSPTQIEYALGKKPAVVLELLETLTTKAVSLCSDVEVVLEDATNAEPKFLYQAIKTAIISGAKTITLCDMAGLMQPYELNMFIKDTYAQVEELKNVNLGFSLSNTLSMAVANMFVAIREGASEIKISAIKSANVLTATEYLNAMSTIGAKAGYNDSINKTAAQVIIKQIENISAEKGGASVFSVSEENSDIDKNISKAELVKLIKSREYELSKEDIDKVYEAFILLAGKKEVSLKELDVIIANETMQVPATYMLKNFSIHISNVQRTVADITLSVGGEEKSGLAYGNGSVEAAFHAIESITGRHFELDEFEVGAVTEGREAVGQTLVKLRNDGKLYSGRGISTDIVGASINAYLSALNKIIYEEKSV